MTPAEHEVIANYWALVPSQERIQRVSVRRATEKVFDPASFLSGLFGLILECVSQLGPEAQAKRFKNPTQRDLTNLPKLSAKNARQKIRRKPSKNPRGVRLTKQERRELVAVEADRSESAFNRYCESHTEAEIAADIRAQQAGFRQWRANE